VSEVLFSCYTVAVLHKYVSPARPSLVWYTSRLCGHQRRHTKRVAIAQNTACRAVQFISQVLPALALCRRHSVMETQSRQRSNVVSLLPPVAQRSQYLTATTPHISLPPTLPRPDITIVDICPWLGLGLGMRPYSFLT